MSRDTLGDPRFPLSSDSPLPLSSVYVMNLPPTCWLQGWPMDCALVTPEHVEPGETGLLPGWVLPGPDGLRCVETEGYDCIQVNCIPDGSPPNLRQALPVTLPSDIPTGEPVACSIQLCWPASPFQVLHIRVVRGQNYFFLVCHRRPPVSRPQCVQGRHYGGHRTHRSRLRCQLQPSTGRSNAHRDRQQDCRHRPGSDCRIDDRTRQHFRQKARRLYFIHSR